MSSSVKPLSGDYKSRQEIGRQAVKGLFHHLSENSNAGYVKDKNNNKGKHRYDVIIVNGRHHSVKVTPEDRECEGFFNFGNTSSYASPDFIIKLEKPDTWLYYVKNWLPYTAGDASYGNFFVGLYVAMSTAAIALMVALSAGHEWPSPLFSALAAAAATLIYWLFLRFYFLILVAAISGVIFIIARVIFTGQSFRNYQTIVSHMADCDDRDLRDIHGVLRLLIFAPKR